MGGTQEFGLALLTDWKHVRAKKRASNEPITN